MTTLEDQLHDHFAAVKGRPTPAGSPAAARQRAARRTRNTRFATGGVVLMALAAAFSIVPIDGQSIDSADTTPVTQADATDTAAQPLVWELLGPAPVAAAIANVTSDPMAHPGNAVFTGDEYLAVAGDGFGLRRSADGTTWEPVDFPTEVENFASMHLWSDRAGIVLAWAPGTRPTDRTALYRSDDNGQTFNQVGRFDFHDRPGPDDVLVDNAVVVSAITTGNSNTSNTSNIGDTNNIGNTGNIVIAVAHSLSLDNARLVDRAGLDPSWTVSGIAPDSIQFCPDTLDCPQPTTIALAELGLNPEQLDTMAQVQRTDIIVIDGDGGTTVVDQINGETGPLLVDGDQLIMSAYERSQQRGQLLTSADGERWERTDLAGNIVSIQAVWDGRLVGVDQGSKTVIGRGDDWALGAGTDASFAAGTTMLVGVGRSGSTVGVISTVDGSAWSFQPIDDIIGNPVQDGARTVSLVVGDGEVLALVSPPDDPGAVLEPVTVYRAALP